MNEIHIKFKPFVIGTIVIFFLLFYLAARSPECPTMLQPNAIIATDAYHQQQVPQTKRSSQPFTIYAITPTYARPVQKAELTRFVKVYTFMICSHLFFLTFDLIASFICCFFGLTFFLNDIYFFRYCFIIRLAQTLLLVPYVHWIIVEDAEQNSDLVRNLLIRTGLDQRSTLLFAKTPSDFKLQRKDPSWSKPRGVAQRNEALKWIRKNVKYTPVSRSAIYFVDDDNTYSTAIFEEIKKIEPGKVAVWPVGLVGGLMVEKPVLDTDNRVLGFNSAVSFASFTLCCMKNGQFFHWVILLLFLNYSGVQSDHFPLIWPGLLYQPISY